VEVNGVIVDPGTREVFCGRRRVEMTTLEFDILEMLVRSAGQVVSRDALMESMYNRKATPFDRSIDMHVSHCGASSNRPHADQNRTRRGLSVLRLGRGGSVVRSLFAKILGWFVLTTFLTTLGTILVAAFTYDPYSARQAPFSMLVSMQMREAREAWERGGRPNWKRRWRGSAKSLRRRGSA
jgi:hypothetical protein